MTAAYYIEKLKLEPHPEGGFFKENYRAGETIAALHYPSASREHAAFLQVFIIFYKKVNAQSFTA